MNRWVIRAIKLLKIAILDEDIFNIKKHSNHVKACKHMIKDDVIKEDSILSELFGFKKEEPKKEIDGENA